MPMRRAGFGDPPGFRLDDCSTQRNLSPQGRDDARAIGRRLREQAVPVGRVVSSPWCRCVDTATLLDAGRVHTEGTFGNAVVWSERREALAAGARGVIAGWQGPGNLVVVTHGANIQAVMGGPNPASGETVVVRRGADGALVEIGRIPAPAAR
jgi:broad specificity phosphatase PhoE